MKIEHTETGFRYITIVDATGNRVQVKESRNYDGVVLIPEDDSKTIILTENNAKNIKKLASYLKKCYNKAGRNMRL